MWTPPSTGEFVYKIRFERRPIVADGMGNDEAMPWQLLCGPFNAALRPINGREEVLVGRLSGVQPYELVVHQFAATLGITTEDSAVNVRTGQRLDITAIQDPNQRRMWLSMLAKTGTAEQ